MKRNQYIFLGMALIALPSMAQKHQTQPKDTTMNRTVVVEQEYNPDIMDASKVNVLPKVEEPTVGKKEVEYAVTPSPASQIPAETLQPYMGKETQPTSKPGYIRAGYGNYGNLDLFGNYLFRLSDRDKLNVNFTMNGMNGKLDRPSWYAYEPSTWDAYYYRTRASANYLHQFNRIDLEVAGNFGLSNFNYIPNPVIDKQKFTSGDIHFGVKSTDETLPLQFRAETNLMLYDRQKSIIAESNRKISETLVRTKGLVTGAINDEQLVGIAAEMNNLFYSPRQTSRAQSLFDTHTTVDLNPYYELNNDNWRLHIGANIDLDFKGGKSFYASPDIDLAYIFSDSYMLYAKATGGRLLNDFRRLEEMDPYASVFTPVTDTYEQINARIGFKASPVNGLWFNLFGGYQDLKDDLCTYFIPIASEPNGRIISDLSAYGQFNTNNVYAGAEISYAYKDLFSFAFDATYYHWDAKTNSGSFDKSDALLMKPEFKLGFQAEARPLPALLLNLGYQYIYRGEVYTLVNRKLPAVNNLSFGATYTFYKGISIYAKAENLLNKEYQNYLCYPTPGINFVGGLSFRF